MCEGLCVCVCGFSPLHFSSFVSFQRSRLGLCVSFEVALTLISRFTKFIGHYIRQDYIMKHVSAASPTERKNSEGR